MREIRKLDPVVDSNDTPKPKKNWTFEKGIYFSFGMGAVFVGLIVAGACIYIAYFNYPSLNPDIRGEWKETAKVDPPVGFTVWGYAPKPMTGGSNYEPVKFDHENQVWIFEADPNQDPVPREYFSKWGSSFLARMESSVSRSNVDDLWEFWYEAEPSEPLPEWQVPIHVINNRFATTFYWFAAVGGVIAIVGFALVSFGVFKK